MRVLKRHRERPAVRGAVEHLLTFLRVSASQLQRELLDYISVGRLAAVRFRRSDWHNKDVRKMIHRMNGIDFVVIVRKNGVTHIDEWKSKRIGDGESGFKLVFG